MSKSVVILGGGSAGLIAAVTLKRRIPNLTVTVLRSDKIGIIGVGEGTTFYFGSHFFDYLALNPRKFYEQAQPTWKLGIRFLWGKREDFFYSFQPEFDLAYDRLAREPGFYVDRESKWTGLASACMAHDTAFPRRPDGGPDLRMGHAFHIENMKLVNWLESTAAAFGVAFAEGTVASAERGEQGVTALRLEDGRHVEADFFIDASGFRSELLSRTLDEPWVDYTQALWCDRAWIGGWPRTDEPLHPYTTAETMDSGWAWQIEHEHFINRGYVFSSRFIDDDKALDEFKRRNPKIANEPRLVKFRSGRTRNAWVGNVIGVGNATGFVEPLEATALHIICVQCNRMADILKQSMGRPTQSMIRFFNRSNATGWDDVRDFLAVHYKYNDRLQTPFWKACRAEISIGGAEEFVAFYRDNGPATFCKDHLIHPTNNFGAEGYLAMLIGQEVPYNSGFSPSEDEAEVWQKHLSQLARRAKSGLGVAKALERVKKAAFDWTGVYAS